LKISELASIILELSKDSHNKNLRYIKGLIAEQLHLRNYDKLLKEQDEEEEPILEPEVPVVEPKLEPEAEVESEPETEVEPEEPEATVSTTPSTSEPKTTPTPRQNEPDLNKGIITISKNDARELLSYKGKIFGAIFTKKDGTRRVMNGMTGVRKFTSGGQLPYSPKDKGLIPVYDLKIGMGPKGYRMINIDGLEALKINGKQYRIDKFLREVKINNPVGGIVSTDNPKHYEKGSKQKDTLYNLIKSNPGLAYKGLLDILHPGSTPMSSGGKYLQKLLGELQYNKDIELRTIKNPKTKRNIGIYFINKKS